MNSAEKVNHPLHYGGADDPYEAIKVIEAWSPNLPKGTEFHIGNTLKYLSRSGKKGSALEDLRKARWYLDRAIQQIEQDTESLPDTAASEAAASERPAVADELDRFQAEYRRRMAAAQ